MSLGCFRILYNFISVVPVSSIHPEEKERERDVKIELLESLWKLQSICIFKKFYYLFIFLLKIIFFLYVLDHFDVLILKIIFKK